METSSVSDFDTNPNSNSSPTTSNSRVFGLNLTPLRVFRHPLSTFLEYSGLLRVRPDNPETDLLIPDNPTPNSSESVSSAISNVTAGNSNGEVSIRIIGSGENDRFRSEDADDGSVMDAGEREERGSIVVGSTVGGDSGDGGVGTGNNRDSSYQRYDIQQVARWIEQFLPFSLLLLVVFIRQHLQGFFVVIWITAFMFRSNDILQKQTALKGERKITVLLGYFLVFMLHITGIYWWNHKDDLFYSLIMVPPKVIPPFWHAIFIILVNDTMVRQAAMALKLVLLMYYKNGRGHNFRRQGQLLTLVEYMLLLYRALLPTPVWYRFFLNKDYGSLFSSLITGLYLTFKLTSIVEKVRSFFTALKALSIKEIHYGSHATPEQVNAAGDLCAICQEKMNTPILLRCKHIFCEDCVSEWLVFLLHFVA
ncbi:hypothetical protein HAX54_015797 [Datura stramonium]|uniref:RING-type domain-containing protein n=1 Tax=Datura stramonium TaxID=4076 RepID=A0ABS8RZF0_DATST|nr:hypothetical protein [Datura stramonium]